MPLATPSGPCGGFPASARTDGRLAMTSAAQAIAAEPHNSAFHNRKSRARVLRQANTDPSSAATQTTKLLATGNAMRWHGYAARLGFGITRTKNQSRDRRPTPEKNQAREPRRRWLLNRRPVTGQIVAHCSGRREETGLETFWDSSCARRTEVVFINFLTGRSRNLLIRRPSLQL